MMIIVILQKEETIEVREFREEVKQRAINETTPIPRIYDKECAKAKLSDATTPILPSEREMNSGINKARRAMTPTIPTTQLFDIPEPFTKTLHDDDFLIVDKMITRRQRILLFASREQLKMLLVGRFWIYDFIYDMVVTGLEETTISTLKEETTLFVRRSACLHQLQLWLNG
ncbi:unnamed protein product [Rotaria socialis]|uniref:Uncharacterized protein n=1 Tax=Rotaria socialis TaxID=392032 RepID=A0A818RMQ5_9BILA|nr:unnamed protein product [Rotaria socialis]